MLSEKEARRGKFKDDQYGVKPIVKIVDQFWFSGSRTASKESGK